MENNLTAEDLINCVCLPCTINDYGDVKYYIQGVDVNKNIVIVDSEGLDPKNITPILRRLIDITVEETVFITCNIMKYNQEDKESHLIWNQNDKQMIEKFGFFQLEEHDFEYIPIITSYLIKRGFNLGLLPEGSYLEMDEDSQIIKN